MSWLTPLGLLGLLGIAILILIYIIKPNFQQKMVSSTYVWKLSLKYRKKRIPINRIRNLLIFLCQILVITSCALILTQPVIKADIPPKADEKIAIIDASASMRAGIGEETRFDRAVDLVRSEAQEVFRAGGLMSVIVADSKSDFLVQRIGAEQEDELYSALNELIKEDACSYGSADIGLAMSRAESVLAENAGAEVLFYTGNRYLDTGNVTVVDVSKPEEWNAAILNCSAEIVENYYTVTVEVASYGQSKDLTVNCVAHGANYEKTELFMKKIARCENDEPLVITFDQSDVLLYSYESLELYLEEDDAFSYDNRFYLYGGTKDVINVQYYSTLSNTFFSSMLLTLRDRLRPYWDLNIKEVREGSPAVEGFDFYIYEHTMPTVLPTDGVVFLADPDRAPGNAGLVFGDVVKGDFQLVAGESHPIMNYVTPEKITVSQYTRVTLNDGFSPLMYCAGDPVLLVKNLPQTKMVVMPFSLNYSNLAALFVDFSALMSNIFDYFLPPTLTEYVFDVGESVTLRARGEYLNVTGPIPEALQFKEFPQVLPLSVFGTYTLMQPLMTEGMFDEEQFFVKIPAAESNIVKVLDELETPYVEKLPDPLDRDLLLYFAIALVALLFLEWWLQTRENY